MSDQYKDGEIYHVYNRGAHRMRIFCAQENYRYCQRLLAQNGKRYGVSVHAYSLMPTHYHMVLKQNDGGSIQRFIQTTFNAYVQAFNRRWKHSGTLFQGRAKRKLVQTDSYALQLSRYIHLNPVLAGLVKNPEEWQFSDYRHWIDQARDPLSDSRLRNLYFTSGSEYQSFVKEFQKETDGQLFSKYFPGEP